MRASIFQLHSKRRRGALLAPVRFLSFLLLVAIAKSICQSQEVVLDSFGFEQEELGATPRGWHPFHQDSYPFVRVISLTNGNRVLRGERSDSTGWSSLSVSFPEAQNRIQVEFSFAYALAEGRTLNVWSHEPGGSDASQFNLCIQEGALLQFDGRIREWVPITRNIEPSTNQDSPVWHRLRVVVDASSQGIDYWVSNPGDDQLPADPKTMAAYRSDLDIGSLDFVSGQRIGENGWYLIDDLVVIGGDTIPAPGDVPALPDTYQLWAGPNLPTLPDEIPFVRGVRHQTIHQATEDSDKFLHGAAIFEHDDVFYANWANSPVNENGPSETLKGRRSIDRGITWSDIETIGRGFEGDERHSHGILFEHNRQVWTICARFGVGDDGRRFPGLCAEAYVLNEDSNAWESRGIVMRNCWPYDEPVLMANGSYITGGQDKDGLPVVAISDGDNLLNWESVNIPFSPLMRPGFAETTVWSTQEKTLAIIRGGGGVAWVSTSDDFGQSWSTAQPSNFPMPRSKAYLGMLSTGQMYLLSNFRDRNTLVISVGEPGELSINQIFRIRDGLSEPPRFPGRAKGKQWSYPYGFEYDGNLYVVYSIGKEDAGMSVFPISGLTMEQD